MQSLYITTRKHQGIKVYNYVYLHIISPLENAFSVYNIILSLVAEYQLTACTIQICLFSEPLRKKLCRMEKLHKIQVRWSTDESSEHLSSAIISKRKAKLREMQRLVQDKTFLFNLERQHAGNFNHSTFHVSVILLLNVRSKNSL